MHNVLLFTNANQSKRSAPQNQKKNTILTLNNSLYHIKIQAENFALNYLWQLYPIFFLFALRSNSQTKSRYLTIKLCKEAVNVM